MERSYGEHRMLAHAGMLERQATCYRVLGGEERAADMVERLTAHAVHRPHGLTAIDAALLALRHTGGNVMSAAEMAEDDAARHMHTVWLARRARECGLHLADCYREMSDSGDAEYITLTFAYVDPALAHQRDAHREVLTRALHYGLVAEERHCQHSYDCCGHWYPSRARVEVIGVNLYAVSQSVLQNV